MPVWNSFEHLIWRNIVQSGLGEADNFLLSVSGGLDSIVLLQIMQRLKPSAKMAVAHFHHGDCISPEQQKFRDDSYAFVSQLAEKGHIPFIGKKSEVPLMSEDDCRQARWRFIKGVKTEGQVILTGHHQDDQLETMLLKLIRGAGAEGVAGFKMKNGEIFRPFLNVPKNELLAYAETNKLTWLEDPSNTDTQFLRNWLREVWLPALEARVPGGPGNLGRSLYNLVLASTEVQSFELSYAEDGQTMSRLWFNLLPGEQQIRALAVYLRQHKIYEFTTGQLNEIRKRLDKNQKDITFDLVGKKWVINATQIMLR